MKKLFLFSLIATGIITDGYGGTFNSNVSSGAFNSAASWTLVSGTDADGFPDADDDIVILTGHTISVTSTGNINNVTVQGTLTINSSGLLNIYGNYTVTGTEAGNGPLLFKGSTGGLTISGSGTFNANVRYTFSSGSVRTISAGTTITKALIGIASASVTNLGNLTLTTVNTSTGANFTNGATGVLTLRVGGFMAGRVFNASTAGNTVRLQYSGGSVPACTGNTFHHLTILSTGIKALSANTVVNGNLTINTGNTLNTNNFSLSVAGNWSSSGAFTATSGIPVTFNGTSAQTVSNTSGTTTFTELVINNAAGVTLTSGTYVLDEVLTITAGTFNTGGRPFTMTSTATRTARIAPLGLTGAIAGNFTIQRFITARDTSFADLSSPVQNSTFNDWDNELPAISYTSSPPDAEASAATYDEMADTYVPVTTSATALNPGQGFEIFLSGDFSYASFPATTMNTIGVPNQGDFDLSSTVSNTVQGWNLVGNPFASSISWSDVYTASGGAASGMYDYIEMYDYTIQDWNGYTTADGIEIGSTQGFWVYGLSGPMTLMIPESSKTTSSNSSIKSAKLQPYFMLKMSGVNSTASHFFKVSASPAGIDALDNLDIPFRKSPSKATPELYCVVDGKNININSFNSGNPSFSIALKTKVAVSGKYRIEPSGFDFIPEYTCVKLVDQLAGTVIDLSEGNGYCFTSNTTDNPDRFILLLSKDADNCGKATIAAGPSNSQFGEQVEILTTPSGNTLNFNLSEATSTTISLVNVLGQNITESIRVNALDQSVNIALPEGYSGMYILHVESAKGSITRKFVKK